ncbi:MAG: PKD domain-containing protein [Planctomycetota bacterium]
MRCRPALSLIAAPLLACVLPAQTGLQCLATIQPFAANNGGSVGGVVFLDADVHRAVDLTDIVCNLQIAAPGAPVGPEIYAVEGGYAGREQAQAGWASLGLATGTMAGRDQRTVCTLAAPARLMPGTWGLALVATGGTAHAYTNGATALRTFADANLTLRLGAAANAPFVSAPIGARIANLELCYDIAPGLFPAFEATPTSGASPLTVQFQDLSSSTDPGGITQWLWDLDGDGTSDSTAQNPTFVYTAGGTYSVTLSVSDASHGRVQKTVQDLIVVDPITASFDATPTSGTVPLTVQFADTSSGSPTIWAWDFDGDGVTDSTLQNPSHVYSSVGSYTVALTVTNAIGRQDTVLRSSYVVVLGGTNNVESADILEYQFNEPRGFEVANTASTTIAPAFGTLPTNRWQADPQRSFFGAQDPGYGALGADDVAPFDAVVDTGWNLDLTGSFTFCFWSRRTVNAGMAQPSYAFGVADGSSARCYYNGGRLSLRGFGLVPSVDSGVDPGSLSGWQHYAVVVDDQAGTASWYLNGFPDGPLVRFPAGSVRAQGGSFLIGGFGASDSRMTRYFEFDDFRLYGRAMTAFEIQAGLSSENPTTALFGSGCPGPTGIPSLSAAGGAPSALGNPGFRLQISGMQPGMPAYVNLGLKQTSARILPFNVGAVLDPYVGCSIDCLNDLIVLGAPNLGGSGLVSVPIAADPVLANFHIYAQVMVLSLQRGAVSRAMIINVK